jgi:hypothetical protein
MKSFLDIEATRLFRAEDSTIHPKTGHETAILKPDRWGPTAREVVIHIEHNNNEVDGDIWFARIVPKDYTCKCEKPDPIEYSKGPCMCLFDVGWLTHGDSPANAMHMAFDLMSTYWDECRAEREGNVAHCWCVDTVMSMPWEDPPGNARYIQCCRCGHAASIKEFEKFDEPESTQAP